MQLGYLENFIQATFNTIDGAAGKTFVVGGDGRYFNAEAIQIIIKMAAAGEAAKVIVGRSGLLSTPAASHLIRQNKADGGFILTASHNPGGVDEDFGVKFNIANGGPAPGKVTNAIFEQTKYIFNYSIANETDIDLQTASLQMMGEMLIEIVDPVVDYQELMSSIFDFDKIRSLFASGFSMRFDAMHAVTGPYAKSIFQDTLGAADGTVLNGIPMEDFGGGHPDPNPVWAKKLIDLMMSDNAPDFGAASDGDGDRNMIVGRNIYVTPSDSLAILLANAHLVPGYKKGLTGVARSMPTSAACDLVAEKLGIDCYETPTGWKFFGNLLDAGKVAICGEESAGTGSNHVREKDGLWAVLFWLNILAERRQSVAEIMQAHWQAFGRNYYSRHDYEAIPSATANALMSDIRNRLPALVGQEFAGEQVRKADEFFYSDPVDGSTSKNQGIRIFFESRGRVVFRLSGTSTRGATLRIYLEQYAPRGADYRRATQLALDRIRHAALEISKLEDYVSRAGPDVMT